MKFHIASIIQGLVKLTFQTNFIVCTAAGTLHCRSTGVGVQLGLKESLNKTGDHNIADIFTYYGDMYGALLFHKSY